MTVCSTVSLSKGICAQIVAVVTGSLVALSDGMQYGWTAPMLPILLGENPPVPVTEQQAEWLETCVMLGAFGGLWVTMYMVDKIGRKRSILVSAFVSLIIWIVMAVAPRVEYIIAARTFSGAVGNLAFVATPMYIAEIADKRIRGFLSSLIFLMSLFGILVIYCVVPYVPFYVPNIIGAVVVTIAFVSFTFMPASPYYLIFKDKPEEAKKSLTRLRGNDLDVDKELNEIKEAVARQKEESGRIRDLFLIPSNRKAILIMTILNTAQHFSGISVILMNLHSILEAGGTVYMKPSTTGVLFSVLMVTAAATASFIIDKFGRKGLLISSSCLTGLSLMVLAIYFSLKNSEYDVGNISWIPIVCVMIYAVVFKAGLGIVPIVLTAEIFPAKMKAYGMTLADGVYVIAATISLQVYQRIKEFGIEYPFYIFSLSCYITGIFTYFYIPETKGKSLEQIQMMLKGEDVHVEKVEKGTHLENGNTT